MKLLNVMGLILALAASATGKNDGICLKVRVCYHKELLVPPPVKVRYVGLDHRTEELYFTYWSNNRSDPFNDKIVKINLQTKELTALPIEVPIGHTAVGNLEDHEIYTGYKKISKYNLKSNITTKYDVRYELIPEMYYKNGLYIKMVYFHTVEVTSHWFTFNDGNYSIVSGLENCNAWNLLMDDDGTRFFTNSSGLYRQKEGAMLHAQYSVSSMAMDPEGQLYANVYKDGLYLVDKETLQLNKLADLPEAVGITFDTYGNIIYDESRGGLYILRPNGSKC